MSIIQYFRFTVVSHSSECEFQLLKKGEFAYLCHLRPHAPLPRTTRPLALPFSLRTTSLRLRLRNRRLLVILLVLNNLLQPTTRLCSSPLGLWPWQPAIGRPQTQSYIFLVLWPNPTATPLVVHVGEAGKARSGYATRRVRRGRWPAASNLYVRDGEAL